MGDPTDHLDHDVERLVDYVDDELDVETRSAAERQIAGCADCSALVEDLRTLAVATREATAPERPRDFRLTDADAVRLRAEAGEPELIAAGARPAGEMTMPTVHADHDPLLIAAAADGRVEPADQARVAAWLATCTDCATLRDDLLAIAAANRTLWTPPRPRDFLVSESDAARLRRRGLRGLVGWIGSSRDTLTRPLALGLTTLGLAGLLLTNGTALMPFGSAASGPTILSTVGAAIGDDSQQDAATESDRNVFTGQGEAPDVQGPTSGGGEAGAAPAASAAASAGPAALPSAAAPVPDSTGSAVMAAPSAMALPDRAAASTSQLELASPAGAPEPTAKAASDETAPPLAAILSLGLLAVGLGLFVLRRLSGSARA